MRNIIRIGDKTTGGGTVQSGSVVMKVDSELNIAHEWMSVTQDLRRRLWNLHTGKKGAQDDPEEAFIAWTYIIKENKARQSKELKPDAPLVEFYYDKATLKDLD